MLSRVAERTYWLGRYMERVESFARLISINTELMLDLPDVDHTWDGLIRICGADESYSERFSGRDERRVVTFLLEDNHGSVLSSAAAARENARTIREIMPTESWTVVNALYQYVKRHHAQAIDRNYRNKFMQEVMGRCHQLAGLLASNMSEDLAYKFLSIGRNLERADMTTRILDVGCFNLIDESGRVSGQHDNILWMSVLRSLSAYQAYRQEVRDRVTGELVANFLLKDLRFPRSVVHCLQEVQNAILKMPRNDPPLDCISQQLQMLTDTHVLATMETNSLSSYIDELQAELSSMHNVIASHWFDPDVHLRVR
ncbi:MAG: hypothetical protein CMQ05_13495 [Gammaproteobacteria bacterium]|nr:hypothetical protein [Gammaproteobacteria bacterium]RPG23826.1 MAG: alpha-E domain-containing protein [Gammaproteobacteria bacterium TMED50]|tara:strand:- start:2235 stop:3176 length:942 start_codon:yes stop_codon:yes gene_type:complete